MLCLVRVCPLHSSATQFRFSACCELGGGGMREMPFHGELVSEGSPLPSNETQDGHGAIGLRGWPAGRVTSGSSTVLPGMLLSRRKVSIQRHLPVVSKGNPFICRSTPFTVVSSIVQLQNGPRLLKRYQNFYCFPGASLPQGLGVSLLGSAASS